MKTSTLKILRTCSLTIALLGSAAFVTVVSVPDMAFAKSGNDGGKGAENGKGKENDASNGKSNGSNAKSNDGGEKSKSKSSGSETSSKTKSKSSTKSKRLSDELGVSASELGALNAAHANANAFKNASPNSRVGRIGAYRDAVVEGRELEAEFEEKSAVLDAMTPPARDVSLIETDLNGALNDVATKSDDVARLEADLAMAGGADPSIEAELAAARDALANAEATERSLQVELAEAEAYATLEAQLADLEARLQAQPELERDLLDAAANKPVTDAVEEAVKKLLGL